MSTALKPVVTRFRAYQLGEPGSSFSYFADGHFTLIEAMVTELSRPRLTHRNFKAPAVTGELSKQSMVG